MLDELDKTIFNEFLVKSSKMAGVTFVIALMERVFSSVQFQFV